MEKCLVITLSVAWVDGVACSCQVLYPRWKNAGAKASVSWQAAAGWFSVRQTEPVAGSLAVPLRRGAGIGASGGNSLLQARAEAVNGCYRTGLIRPRPPAQCRWVEFHAACWAGCWNHRGRHVTPLLPGPRKNETTHDQPRTQPRQPRKPPGRNLGRFTRHHSRRAKA